MFKDFFHFCASLSLIGQNLPASTGEGLIGARPANKAGTVIQVIPGFPDQNLFGGSNPFALCLDTNVDGKCTDGDLPLTRVPVTYSDSDGVTRTIYSDRHGALSADSDLGIFTVPGALSVVVGKTTDGYPVVQAVCPSNEHAVVDGDIAFSRKYCKGRIDQQGRKISSVASVLI